MVMVMVLGRKEGGRAYEREEKKTEMKEGGVREASELVT